MRVLSRFGKLVLLGLLFTFVLLGIGFQVYGSSFVEDNGVKFGRLWRNKENDDKFAAKQMGLSFRPCEILADGFHQKLKRLEYAPKRRIFVQVALELEGLASLGGLGAAVRTFLLGSGEGVVVLPHYAFVEDADELFRYRIGCGMPGFPSTARSLDGVEEDDGLAGGEYVFSAVRYGPGKMVVLVRPPEVSNPFAAVKSGSEIYAGAITTAGQVYAHGVALALGAICGRGSSIDCAGALFHGSHMARAIMLTRQLSEESGFARLQSPFRLSSDFRILYMMHDALSEVSMLATREDVETGVGLKLMDSSLEIGYWRERLLLDGGVSPENLPLSQGLDVLVRLFSNRVESYVRLTTLAALHADVVAIVSPSLAEALLPPGIGVAPIQVQRVLDRHDHACRVWSILPVAQEPTPHLEFPSLLKNDKNKDTTEIVRQLVAAKERARVQLLGDGFAGPIQKRRFIALFVGRFESNKGAALIPGIAKHVCENNGHMLVVSTGPVDDATRSLWDELHTETKTTCGEHLTIIPGRDEVHAPLARAAADVCLIPSWLEGYALVGTEAIRHGCYLVVSDTTGLRDMAIMAGVESLSNNNVNSRGKSVPFPRRVDHRPPTPSNMPSSCPDRSAAVFSFAIESRTLYKAPQELSSAKTLENFSNALQHAIQDLLTCNTNDFATVAFRTASALATPERSAERIFEALDGKYSCGKAPIHQEPLAFASIIDSLLDYKDLVSTREKLDLHQPLSDQGSLWTPEGVCNTIDSYGAGGFKLDGSLVHLLSGEQEGEASGVSHLRCFDSAPLFVTVSVDVDVCNLLPHGKATLTIDAWNVASPYGTMLEKSIIRPASDHSCTHNIAVTVDLGIGLRRIVITLSTIGSGQVTFSNLQLSHN